MGIHFAGDDQATVSPVGDAKLLGHQLELYQRICCVPGLAVVSCGPDDAALSTQEAALLAGTSHREVLQDDFLALQLCRETAVMEFHAIHR